jgi:hypothetical protein
MSLNHSVACVPSVVNTKYVKNEAGNYVCPHNGCGKITTNQNTMYYHIMDHTDKLPFQCNRCTNSPQFKQRRAYMNHLATRHTDDPKLTDKEKEVLGGISENPVAAISFKCPSAGCTQTTHVKSNMLIHYARTHAKEWIPPYVRGEACKRCHQPYASSSAYLYHTITCFREVAPADQLKIISRIR